VVVNGLRGNRLGSDGGNEGPARDVADEIEALGGKAIAECTDITDEAR